MWDRNFEFVDGGSQKVTITGVAARTSTAMERGKWYMVLADTDTYIIEGSATCVAVATGADPLLQKDTPFFILAKDDKLYISGIQKTAAGTLHVMEVRPK